MTHSCNGLGKKRGASLQSHDKRSAAAVTQSQRSAIQPHQFLTCLAHCLKSFRGHRKNDRTRSGAARESPVTQKRAKTFDFEIGRGRRSDGERETHIWPSPPKGPKVAPNYATPPPPDLIWNLEGFLRSFPGHTSPSRDDRRARRATKTSKTFAISIDL